MKNYILFLIAFLCIHCQVASANNWSEANDAYAAGAYLQAISMYESMESYEQQPQILYNLGNAYFQINKIGKSILNFEKALKYEPANKEVWHNLQIARAKIVNPYDDVKASVSFLDTFIYTLPTGIWLLLCLLVCGLGSYLFIIKKNKFIGGMMIGLSILIGILTHASIRPATTADYGIILKTYPAYYKDENLQEQGDRIIPEGTKVKILQVGDVVQVQLPNGIYAYVSAADIGRI